MSSPRVHLTTLSVRTSARGRHICRLPWQVSVVAFAGEPTGSAIATWDIFLAQPEPRDGTLATRQGPPEHEADRRAR